VLPGVQPAITNKRRKEAAMDREQDEECREKILKEWFPSLDAQRAIWAWADTLPFTIDELHAWVNRSREFKTYVEQRMAGLLAELKRQSRIYEKDGRLCPAKNTERKDRP
jgi:hypothetical protein